MRKQPLSATLSRIAATAVQWIRHRTMSLAGRMEWDTLSSDTRRQVCSDVGLSMSDMTHAFRAGGQGRELAMLLTRPALGQLRVSTEVLRDMQRVCTFCLSRKRCQSWQAGACMTAKWPAFCPNGYTFVSLERSAPVSAGTK